MRSKMAAFCSGGLLVVYGLLPVGVRALPTLAVAGGGAAVVTVCSSDRSDTRQDARTSERTENRVEERHD